MKKIFGSIMAVLLVVGLLSACSNSKQPDSQPANSPEGNTTGDEKVVLTIWYEGGDARLPFFKAIEKEMQVEHPNISIDAVTFDNETFMTKVLQAATTTGGVDLVFNDASRLLELQQNSQGGFVDLSDVFQQLPNKDFVTDADHKLSSSGDQLIVMPVNRTIAGLGVKTDVPGVEVSDETMPATWDKFTALGQKYVQAGIPGFTMHLGVDPGQVFNLFLSGSGMNDVWLDGTPTSQVEKNKQYFEEIIGLYAGSDAIFDKDATSESFAEMYTKIQGSKVGMFRVGNWNAGNWDKPDSGVGEYTVTTWPALDGGEGHLVLLNTRGFAVPKNSKSIEAAKTFLQYALSDNAQEESFNTMGSSINVSVVDTSTLSKNQKIFFDPSVKLAPIDAYVGLFPYYNALLEVYENGLTKAFHSKTPDEISKNLDELNKNINEAIEKNK